MVAYFNQIDNKMYANSVKHNYKNNRNTSVFNYSKLPFNNTPFYNKFSRITQRIDTNTIKSNARFQTPIMCRYADSVDWSRVQPSRGGVIVYTVYNGHLYFGLGVDTKSGDITDFGGGIRYKKDHTPIQGALREFMEESLCVFGVYNDKQVKNNLVVFSETMLILFIHLNVDILQITNTFSNRVVTARNPEISGLVWLTKPEFENLIVNGTIDSYFGSKPLYTRVKKLLQKAGDFYKYL